MSKKKAKTLSHDEVLAYNAGAAAEAKSPRSRWTKEDYEREVEGLEYDLSVANSRIYALQQAVRWYCGVSRDLVLSAQVQAEIRWAIDIVGVEEP